jgi:hypothetical protein
VIHQHPTNFDQSLQLSPANSGRGILELQFNLGHHTAENLHPITMASRFARSYCSKWETKHITAHHLSLDSATVSFHSHLLISVSDRQGYTLVYRLLRYCIWESAKFTFISRAWKSHESIRFLSWSIRIRSVIHSRWSMANLVEGIALWNTNKQSPWTSRSIGMITWARVGVTILLQVS